MNSRSLFVNILIVLAASALFVSGIGSVRLFDWDEINFAESAREMLVTGDWFNVRINYESFWEKPPLFIWMQALCMKLFGVGEFAARFPDAVAGVITLLLLFNIGKNTKDEQFGLLWMTMYLISTLPFFYFKSGIIDPWFNLFIFLGIYSFSRYSDPEAVRNRSLNAALSAAATGLAIMTKGPVAFLIFALAFFVWLICVRFRFSFRWKDVFLYLLVLCLVGGAWFIALALTGHADVIRDFIDYQIRLFRTQDAGHGGFFLYHFVVLFFGVAPASIFAIPAFSRQFIKREQCRRLSGLFRWMMVSFWVVLILFTIVRTKIVHYSSFCYFPLTFLAACAADRMLDGKQKFKGYQAVLICSIAFILGAVLTALTLFDRIKASLIPYVNDPFAVSCMEAESEWVGFEPLVGVVLILMTLWFCISFHRRPEMRKFVIIGSANVFFLLTTMLCAVGEVEKYSQASAVDFYISRKGEDCYILPTYFKSYAQYFYSDRTPENTCDDYETLAHGQLDKPCYFVLKDIPEDIARFVADVPDARRLYRKSGFVFFVREQPDECCDAQCRDSQEEKIE